MDLLAKRFWCWFRGKHYFWYTYGQGEVVRIICKDCRKESKI